MHPSKCVQKNMLEAWNFTKIKLHHGCFNINLQNIFRTNTFENATRQILLMAVLMIGLSLDNQLT